MLTPTIVSHWSDGKRIHAIGYFGGKAGDVYLQNEDGVGFGTRISWPNSIKTGSPVIFMSSGLCSLNGLNLNFTTYYLLFNQGEAIVAPGNNNPYIQLYNVLTDAQAIDNLDMTTIAVSFHAIFHKFV